MMESNPAQQKWMRWTIFVLFCCVVAAAFWFLFFTAKGETLRKDPRLLRDDVRGLVHAHPFISPALYIAVYLMFAVAALPVWWLQILAGIGFGLWFGVAWSLVAATMGATISAALVRWFRSEERRVGK